MSDLKAVGDIRAQIAAQRRELTEILAGLSAADWDAPTLCAGWRVRELVAHIVMPFRYTVQQFAQSLAAAGGDFNKMADRCARQDAASLAAGELTAALRDNIDHPWQPPGGGYPGALSHDMIHGLDMTVPMRIDWGVPPDRLRMVLTGLLTPRNLASFGVDLLRVELRADDVEWSAGTGAPVKGAARDLLLAVFGRPLAPGRLRGDGLGFLIASHEGRNDL